MYTLLFLKNEIDREDQTAESDEMVHSEGLMFEHQQRKHRKHDQRDDLLYHLELKEAERAAIAIEADPIGRHLKGIFKQCDAPADEYDAEQTQRVEAFDVFEFQMPVPCHGHKRIRDKKEYDSDDRFLHVAILQEILKSKNLLLENGDRYKTKMAAPFGTTTFEPMKT